MQGSGFKILGLVGVLKGAVRVPVKVAGYYTGLWGFSVVSYGVWVSTVLC